MVKIRDLKVGDRFSIEYEITNITPGFRVVTAGQIGGRQLNGFYLDTEVTQIERPLKVGDVCRYTRLRNSETVTVLALDETHAVVAWEGDIKRSFPTLLTNLRRA